MTELNNSVEDYDSSRVGDVCQFKYGIISKCSELEGLNFV